MNTGDSRALNDWARRFVDDMERSLLDRRFNAVEIVNTDDWERIL